MGIDAGLQSQEPVPDLARSDARRIFGRAAAAFFQKLLDRVKGLPAVAASSLTETVPVALMGNGNVMFSSMSDGGREFAGDS